MTRQSLIALIVLGSVFGLAAALFPEIIRSETAEKTLEQRVAALEQELASRPATAVVDVEELVNTYKKTAELKKRRTDLINEEKEKLDTLSQIIGEVRQKQERERRDSEGWWENEMGAVTKERELAVRQRLFEEKIKRMQMQDLEEVYRDIVASIRKCAVEKGVSLVFWRHADIDEETWQIARREGNLMSHRYMIDIRPILYADEKVQDITEDVKKILAAE